MTGRLLRPLAGVFVLLALTSSCGTGSRSTAAASGPTTTTPEVTTTHPPGGHDHGQALDRSSASAVTADDGRLEIDLDGELIEVTAVPPDAAPTPAEETAAAELLDAVRRSLDRYADRAAAEAAGYRSWQTFDDAHMVHPGHVEDGRVLDPDRPEFLMYDGPRLLGVMFLASSNLAPGPQVGGPLTIWHYHRSGPSCWTAGGLLLDEWRPNPRTDGRCADGLHLSDRSPEMLHVWIVDHADGPFASAMP